MSKTIWIACKQVVEYKKQCTVTDKEYEIIKGLDLVDIDDTEPEYRVIDRYMSHAEVIDVESEYTDVQVTDENDNYIPDDSDEDLDAEDFEEDDDITE